jgi:hypothetical protein
MLNIFRWAILIAAIVLVISLAGAFVSSHPSLHPSYQQSSNKDNQEDTHKKDSKALWDRWFPDSISVFTLWLVIFTAVLGFVGMYQLNFLGRAEVIAAKTSDAAIESNKISRDRTIADQRPWLYVASFEPVGRIRRTQSGDFVISIRLIVKNIGHTPAFYVSTFSEVVVIQPGFVLQSATIAQCDTARKDTSSGGGTIFPGQMSAFDIYPVIKQAVWQKDSVVLIVGCLDYRFLGESDHHHQTRFGIIGGSPLERGNIGVLPDDPTNVDFILRNAGEGTLSSAD